MMTLEIASERVVRKPWGKSDLRPWSDLGQDGTLIGELWFQRVGPAAPEPELLLKLLFTDQALSIQVHPDDAFARAIGLPHGKTEAWYVLAAAPGAEVALGLNQSLTLPQLRAAIVDGTIVDLMHRQVVRAGESIVVSAGTIHAIGAGLVIAEIQQRSDATFRLFDFGRDRELHPDGAVGAAMPGPAPAQARSKRLSATRLIVATSPYFVLEQIDLAPRSHWEVVADREVWILLVETTATITDTLTGKAPVRAAEYMRMSTEHQRYSTENQADAIRQYADRHGFEIVRTFADDGRSGLQLKGPPPRRARLRRGGSFGGRRLGRDRQHRNLDLDRAGALEDEGRVAPTWRKRLCPREWCN